MNKCLETPTPPRSRALLAIALSAFVTACGGGGGGGEPPPRFESTSVGGTAAVRDNATGIVWAASPGNTGPGADEPTAAELWQLADLGADTLRQYFGFLRDATPLIKTKEKVGGVSDEVWAVDFGQADELGSLSNESSSEVKSWYVLSRRSAIPSPTNYPVAILDGTVTAAGLTWKVCTEGRSRTGSVCTGAATPVAANGAQALADAANGAKFAGLEGWRVPSQQELRSLLQLENDVSGSTSTLLPGAFGVDALGTTLGKPEIPVYWTSGRSANGQKAWVVDFSGYSDLGGVELYELTDEARVRLVRNAR
jgi:hypothetical protein